MNQDLTLQHNEQMEHRVTFNNDANEPLLILDKDGFTYKGERIEDAGEAHALFLQVLKRGAK